MQQKPLALGEALLPSFKDYIRKVKWNAKLLAETLLEEGINIVSGGTDNHIVIMNTSVMNITGADAADALETVGITANKNTIPFDSYGPRITGGVRLGTAALTTRGLGKTEFIKIAKIIATILKNMPIEHASPLQKQVRMELQEICKKFPYG